MTTRRDSWPIDFPVNTDTGIQEGLRVLSRTGEIEGRTTGSRRRCSSAGCPGWFIGVKWENGQMMYPCSEGWTYDASERSIRITGGGEISARVISPAPLGTPPLPRDEWPSRESLKGRGWRMSSSAGQT